MAKILCIFSATVSVVLALLFLLDVAVGIPFKKANTLLDIVFIVCALGVGALSVVSLLKQK